MKRIGFAAVAAITLALSFVGTIARADDDSGADTYGDKCATCHGKDGKGDTNMGKKSKAKDLTKAETWKGIDDKAVEKQVREGTDDKRMPAFKDKLSDEEIAAVVKYVRTFQPK
jgi:cbb3-type cytochrome c oxidase subunit III